MDNNSNPYNLPIKTYKNKKLVIPANPIAGKYQDPKFRIKVGRIESEIFRKLIQTTNDPELRNMYSRILERWDRENTEFTLSLSASERIHNSFSKDNF